MNPKPFTGSKTLWVNAIIGLAPLYPPAAEFIKAHPTEIIVGLSFVNFLLRVITRNAVCLFPEDQ